MKSIDEIISEVKAAGRGAGQRRFMLSCFLLMVIGAAAFLKGVDGPQAARVWQAYLVNFLFWTGLAFGTVLVSAALTMTNARWGRPIKRLAEAPGAFLPIAFLLFCGLYFGKEKIFPWIHEPVPHKEAWLNIDFLFARNGIALLVLTFVSMLLIYHSVRRDMKAVAGKDPGEGDKHGRSQTFLAPVFAILYALVLSLIAIDLIMSLDPHWVSTLFGAYYFIACFYSGLAAVIILSSIAVGRLGLGEYIGKQQFHDLGKLLLGFCIVTGDFFYAQFLVIWYGNLPEETKFVILRLNHSPWQPLAWAVLFGCFALPFLVLLIRRIKMRPRFMMVLCSFILVGMWFERFLLVVPSLWEGKSIPFGPTEILITAGFFGTMALCVMIFLRMFPMLPVSDPLFRESLEAAGAEGH
jgi:Ni/Fe-hydrogenase subunit HybB-like protein